MRFILDSLQIFFPWDDDLYTYFKSKGFGKAGTKWKALPLIYSDNTESTIGKPELQRKFVIRPDLFGKTYEQLNWKSTNKPNEPIILAEKPQVEVKTSEDVVTFCIIPIINNKHEYHLEFSSMSAFGKMYSNWAGFYFSLKEFKKLLNFLNVKSNHSNTSLDLAIKREKIQAQREELDYVEISIIYYGFSLEEFSYAKDLLRLSNYEERIPSLVYDSSDDSCQEVMNPSAKIGILYTTEEQGFMKRNPQFVVKISQNKITVLQRGKKAKVKGLIKHANGENLFILDKKLLISALCKLIEQFNKQYKGFFVL